MVSKATTCRRSWLLFRGCLLLAIVVPVFSFAPGRQQLIQRSVPGSRVHSTPPPYNGLQNLQEECVAFMENHENEQEALLKRDSKIYLIPVFVAILAFSFFAETSQAFHSALETLSFHQYTGELSDEIRPLINGPVTLTISILFGSLVSMTISTLYQRQTEIHRTGIATVNEARRIQFLAEALPEPERSTVKNQVKLYSLQYLRSFFNGELFAKSNRSLDLNPILLSLHSVAQKEGGAIYLAELYASINSLKDINIQTVAAIQKNFTAAHYTNLLAQALALLLIYLWETDDYSLVQAHTFELRAAWSILCGTMASLVAIIIDLSTPVSNIISMIRKYQVDMEEMISYGLAKDLDNSMVAVTARRNVTRSN